jgi:arsenate reductase
MAEGFARALGADLLEPWSAGSMPSGKINPTAIQLMKEKGIDLTFQLSKGLNDLPKVQWDYVFTMGCGDACPFVPAVFHEDWTIQDPKNLPLDQFRKIRDEIEEKVRKLIDRAKKSGT